ncbi:hypothetical protein D9619_003679 [Psilocybe cf. subviscida]|uniref:Glycosyltransferase family 25 protein n=1 Tax=Psilocybe cf. subviscida TaxID=2480587 RepID=A0A8H5EUN4_9AGAR|nr:hypothetical protein D9619_003679 [Psilocybe cf. subviscida]
MYSTRPSLIAVMFWLILIGSTTLTMIILNLSPNLSPEIPIPFHRLISIKPEIINQEHLGVSDRIYVLSLPKRRDRRENMEVLRRALNLTWSYQSALAADGGLVAEILGWVASVRDDIFLGKERQPPRAFNFSWPLDIDDIARSTTEIPLLFPIQDSHHPLRKLVQSTVVPDQPLECTTHNYDFPGNTTRIVPEYLILTPAKVACWHSHISVITQIANFSPTDGYGVGIILEDDIDMEEDIGQQIMALWPHLPTDWDIIFLGHCWSDESRGAALTPESLPLGAIGRSSGSRLHLSTSPQCTHAYALSRLGARRLLLHLQYPPFAYSRAIDQALAWLVKSGRLRSVSVVPSLVIQRRVTRSDITSGVGSPWRDYLVHGVLDNIGSANLTGL